MSHKLGKIQHIQSSFKLGIWTIKPHIYKGHVVLKVGLYFGRRAPLGPRSEQPASADIGADAAPMRGYKIRNPLRVHSSLVRGIWGFYTRNLNCVFLPDISVLGPLG